MKRIDPWMRMLGLKELCLRFWQGSQRKQQLDPSNLLRYSMLQFGEL
jgi:hypothetical protein